MELAWGPGEFDGARPILVMLRKLGVVTALR
jgi:hypothetical protein